MRTKRIVATVLTLALCLGTASGASALSGSASLLSTAFTDVSADAWYRGDVDTAVAMGVISGRSETTFAPNENITLAETIKLAAVMNSRYSGDSTNFSNGDPWYQPYVDYALKQNIIQTTNADFDAIVTRESFAGIFASALPDSAYGAINTVVNNSIPDYPIASSRGTAVYKLYRAGIICGDSSRRFYPTRPISRAEVAAIVTRMMNAQARKTVTGLSKPYDGEWVYGGYEGDKPHRIYEVKVKNGVQTGETRYSGTYYDYGTKFRLLDIYPEIYRDYGYLGMNIRFANRSDKPIKYMYVYVTPFNRVDDALATGKYVDFTGPFYKPTISVDWNSDYYFWYDGADSIGAEIQSGGSYYSSQNGEQTLSEEQINQVYQVYHADDLWYDYYEQVAYLAITAVKLQYTDGSTLYLSGNSLAACVW